MNVRTADQAAAEALMSLAARPSLVIDKGDLPAAVRAAAGVLADTGQIFHKAGFLVRVVEAPGGQVRLEPVSHHRATMLVHELCRPVSLGAEGDEKPATLPERAAKMLVDAADAFPPLDGITTAPILSEDGLIRDTAGYDPASRLYAVRVPRVQVAAKPSHAEALAALLKLRETFASFPFADSPRITAADLDHVDLSQPPRRGRERVPARPDDRNLPPKPTPRARNDRHRP
jgi:hypothetical protein